MQLERTGSYMQRPAVPQSPYDLANVDDWAEITEELVRRHPLEHEVLVSSVLAAWEQILSTQIGPLRLGVDWLPSPQLMGAFLHEIIPLEIAGRAAGWRRGDRSEKDVEFPANRAFSFEIKTSSHARNVYGNRSYAQPATATGRSKSGYYLTVNFEKFGSQRPPVRSRIVRIRFGWLDHTDWVPQASSTGQQAHVRPDANLRKLIDLM
jgi:hypothetical protein